jgi:hypothetical protein
MFLGLALGSVEAEVTTKRRIATMYDTDESGPWFCQQHTQKNRQGVLDQPAHRGFALEDPWCVLAIFRKRLFLDFGRAVLPLSQSA